MKNIIPLLLLCSQLIPAHAYCGEMAPAFSDGWRYNDLSSKLNAFFSEFKYFNFQDSKISGAMTYAVISPGFSHELKLNAYFFEAGHMWTMQKTYPLSCVKSSSTDVSANFCNQGGIQVLSFGPTEAKIHVKQDTGPVHWDLTFTAPMSEVTNDITHIPLDSRAPLHLDRLLTSYFMNWAPVMRAGNVTGTVTFADQHRTLSIDTETSYHDENWESWYPNSQPFNWLHFTGLDSSHERADVTLVEFPNNSSKAVGLQLFSGGVRRFWAPGEFHLIRVTEGQIPITRRYGEGAEVLRDQTIDPQFENGSHTVATRYQITTDDDQLQVELTVLGAISTTASKPGSANALLVDEQVVDARIRFLAPGGDQRTAAGPGEFMNVMTDP